MQKWSETYFNLFLDTRLLTQIVSFVFAVLMFLVLGESIYITAVQFCTLPQGEILPDRLADFVKESIVGIFTAILFSIRFLLLFSKNKTSIWFSQLVWMILFLTLWLQASSLENGGCTKNVFPFYGESLSYALVFYMLLSPIRQILTLIGSFFKLFQADA